MRVRIALLAALAALLTPFPADAKRRPAPKVSVGDVQLAEPAHESVASASFRVSVPRAHRRAIVAGYITAPGSAAAGADYEHSAGIVRIPRGRRSAVVRIPVLGDLAEEPTEQFTLRLFGPATRFRDPVGRGSIRNRPSHCVPPAVQRGPHCYSPATMYDVNRESVGTGERVLLAGLLVTHSASGAAWLGVVPGDPGYDGPEFSATELDLSGIDPAPSLSAGERIDLFAVVEPGGFVSYERHETLSLGEVLPTAESVTDSQLEPESEQARAWHAVLVQMADQELVSELAGQWTLDSKVLVDDRLIGTLPDHSPGTKFTSLTGFADSDDFLAPAILPRTGADIVPVPPVVLAGFDFSSPCVSVGQANVSLGTVSLAAPAPSDTFITITTDVPSVATVVGGGTTVAEGETSAQVRVNGHSEGMTTLQATLGSQSDSRSLSVADPCA